jgi:hypothetical protein
VVEEEVEVDLVDMKLLHKLKTEKLLLHLLQKLP